MLKKLSSLIAMVGVIALSSCSKSEPERAAPPPAPPAETAAPPAPEPRNADPTEVDSGHYTAEFENDRVRVVRIAYGPGEASVMHYHPDSVAVFLTDHLVEMTMPDGETEEISAKAGDAIYLPGGQHLPKNISDERWELVLVELGSGGSSTPDAAGPDSTVVDADHYTAEIDNDRVRIVRIAYGPGEASVMHYHPDSVAVFLTDQIVEMTMPDGETQEMSTKAGDVIFSPAGQHLPKNISDAPLELILVELK